MKTEKKILIVEDDPYTNELLTSLLAARGYTVASAATGEEAVEYVKNKTPDLVILDLLLPRLDGWEVCRVIRKPGARTARVPILIVSILSRFDSVFSDPEMSNVSFFSKPFESAGLVAEVERILEGLPH